MNSRLVGFYQANGFLFTPVSKELKESDLGLFLLLVFLTEGLSVFLGMAWLSSSGILKLKGADCRQYEH